MIEQLTEKDRARFWSHVAVVGDDECWPWLGEVNKDGYGLVKFTINKKRRTFQSHRIARFFATGERLESSVIARHKCDYPRCCNPSHILTGTHADNVRDRVERGRSARITGDANRASKITEAQAQDLIARYRAGGVRQRDLAAEYGISQAAVSMIVNGERRSHLLT